MKTITRFLISILLLQSIIVNAQDKGKFNFTKANDTIKFEGYRDSDDKFSEIEFKFEVSFLGSNIEIWSEDEKQVQLMRGKKFGKGSSDIQPNTDSHFLITIENDHKVKECSDCEDEVTEAFTIKLDNSFYGPFYLKSIVELKNGEGSQQEKSEVYQPGYLFYDALYIKQMYEQKDFRKISLHNSQKQAK
ncbi:MAG: hypothetical protein HN347_10530 [Bacteroidetes bacterium]|jgi:hypothetical protein|nr:hypothetical protein [Bacteroidota bacterium]